MSFYDTPVQPTYNIPAANLAAAFTRTIVGPFNKRGRIRRVMAQVTTSIVGGPPTLTLSTVAPPVQDYPADTSKVANTTEFTWAIPVTAAPAGLTSDTAPNNVAKDTNYFDYILPANTPVVLTNTPGACTAGVADLELSIDWF